MEIGEQVITSNLKLNEALAGINEKRIRLKSGKKLKKNDEVSLFDKNGKASEFTIHRIIGSDYIILVEKNKRPKMSLMERMQLVFESVRGKL